MSVCHWLLFQIADSAFPAGGFAHSAGMEAAVQHGHVAGGDSLEAFIRAQLKSIAQASGPFVVVGHRSEHLDECDHVCHATLANHVANRASRAQGHALILAASRIFDNRRLLRLAADLRDQRLAGHLAPMFGVVCGELGIELEPTVRLFLFQSLRGLISAAVRLGITGPLEGQSVQARVAIFGETLANPVCNMTIEDAAQTAPLIDLVQGTQDRLYSRLFQS